VWRVGGGRTTAFLKRPNGAPSYQSRARSSRRISSSPRSRTTFVTRSVEYKLNSNTHSASSEDGGGAGSGRGRPVSHEDRQVDSEGGCGEGMTGCFGPFVLRSEEDHTRDASQRALHALLIPVGYHCDGDGLGRRQQANGRPRRGHSCNAATTTASSPAPATAPTASSTATAEMRRVGVRNERRQAHRQRRGQPREPRERHRQSATPV
jgi:hypothetical protein